MSKPFNQPNLANYIREGSDAHLKNIIFADGTEQSTAGGSGGGGNVSTISFDNTTRKIELTQTSGTSPLDATIPQNEVSSLAFNNVSNVLTINQSYAAAKTVTINPSGSGSSTTNIIHSNISDGLIRKVKELDNKIKNLGNKKEGPIKKIKLQGKERILKK